MSRKNSINEFQPRSAQRNLTGRTYVAALRKGLQEAINVIEAFDGMTAKDHEFEQDVLEPLRRLSTLRLAHCPVCNHRRKLVALCPDHE